MALRWMRSNPLAKFQPPPISASSISKKTFWGTPLVGWMGATFSVSLDLVAEDENNRGTRKLTVCPDNLSVRIYFCHVQTPIPSGTPNVQYALRFHRQRHSGKTELEQMQVNLMHHLPAFLFALVVGQEIVITVATAVDIRILDIGFEEGARGVSNNTLIISMR